MEQEEEQEEREEEGEQDSVTAAAAALAAVAMKEEEEEEDECSVCLNAIDSNDAGNPAGPPLVCGHRFPFRLFLGAPHRENPMFTLMPPFFACAANAKDRTLAWIRLTIYIMPKKDEQPGG